MAPLHAVAQGTVNLALEGGQTAQLSRIVITNGQGSLKVDVSDGQHRQLLNSPQLSGIPSLGDLSVGKFPRDQLGPNSMIGAAWHDAGTLMVVIDEPLVRLEAIQAVTLFNDRWSYRLLGKLGDHRLDMAEDIPNLGDVPTVQRWLRLLPEPDDVRLLTVGTRRNPSSLLSANARARADIEVLGTFYAGDVHRHQGQLGIVIYPSQTSP